MSGPPKDIGSAVPEDFRLPHNTTRTMADVWAEERHNEMVARGRRGGEAKARNLRKKFVEDYQNRKRLTKSGKIPFAGYDPEEARS